ncbi:hypothetical protein H8A99_05055 [Bradyrhizobium sp. Arg68]|uniref:sugar phosphate nucleotidyltransferase n=1 Tax=Bradyrhizobium ivorense TaxID=2511166 RepID=UPI001E526C8C|nr:sugar phosphate nucleotidyltransferase [Bradyrhizobium ivorense]MCC8935877.1 hypothetical protein [Bradyrhizobium ivorense]
MTNYTLKGHQHHAEPWKVALVDIGEKTMTSGRLKRAANYLTDDNAFCLTYGDGVAHVDIAALIAVHRRPGTLATLTATDPPSRFGALQVRTDHRVATFKEKPWGEGRMMKGGFFVLSPKVIDLLVDDSTVWECEPLVTLAEQQQLSAHQHNGRTLTHLFSQSEATGEGALAGLPHLRRSVSLDRSNCFHWTRKGAADDVASRFERPAGSDVHSGRGRGIDATRFRDEPDRGSLALGLSEI